MIKVHWYAVGLIVLGIGVGTTACQPSSPEGEEAGASDSVGVAASDSLDAATGLVIDDALPVVVGNCTGCHSAQLITQNRATREGWQHMIEWMQETQKLWDLGANETAILDYLEKHYAPEKIGRRKNLGDIEWYDLPENPS